MFCRSNVLLGENLNAVIADFGFSIQVPKSFKNTTLVTAKDGLAGTAGYRAPEYADLKYSTKSDVYAFGIVSFSLCAK